MHLTFVTLASLFFINVLATPIIPEYSEPLHHQRRSPNEPGGNFKAAAKCKRATPNESIESLTRSNVDSRHPLLEKEECSVYRLNTKVDNENVVLKVVQNGLRTEWAIKREVWGLENVGQLLGWAHTPNQKLYYLFMKNMGVPLSQTEATFRNDHERVRKLQREAEETYLTKYHLEHYDHNEKTPNNWVFRKVGGEWRAELVDWECFIEDSNYKGYKDPPKAFEIHPDRCDLFVPPMMEKYLKVVNTGSA